MIYTLLIVATHLTHGNRRAMSAPFAVDSVNVQDLGIVGDGLTDHHATLQKAFDTYEHVFIPSGRYLISQPLMLRSGQRLWGSDSTVFSIHPIAKKTDSFIFIKTTRQRDLQINRLTFYAHDVPERSQAAYALELRNVHEVTINQVSTYHCGVVHVSVTHAVNYSDLSDSLSSDAFRAEGNSQVHINRCQGIGSTKSIAHHGAGVLISYTDGWSVSHSSFSRYSHGIQWWGGDSNPKRDGKLDQVRKCRDGLISNVRAEDVRGGGIWGSMGENIIVENCQVARCGDVGIDFEGCFNAQARYNVVRDCQNGTLAIFHYNRDIVFVNNQSIQSDPKRPLACIYNASQSPDNGKVVFTNNTFVATRGVGTIYQRGPSRNIVFTNNSLHNVVLDLSFNNNQRVRIENNMVAITRPSNWPYMIKAGYTHHRGTVSIANNQIMVTSDQSPETYAICVVQSDYNSSPTNRIIDNYITGIPRRYSVDWKGKNRAFTAQTLIETEQPFAGSDLRIVDEGSRKAEVKVNGKRWNGSKE